VKVEITSRYIEEDHLSLVKKHGSVVHHVIDHHLGHWGRRPLTEATLFALIKYMAQESPDGIIRLRNLMVEQSDALILAAIARSRLGLS
jgi:hypothetical protein